jgi:hypothetical protein
MINFAAIDFETANGKRFDIAIQKALTYTFQV